MANPTAIEIVETDIGGAVQATQYLDASGAVLLGGRQAFVADAAADSGAGTVSPAVYTAHASGAVTVVSNASTDLDTTAAALAILVTEVITYEAAIKALIVDVASMRTAVNSVLDVLENHGLMADA